MNMFKTLTWLRGIARVLWQVPVVFSILLYGGYLQAASRDVKLTAIYSGPGFHLFVPSEGEVCKPEMTWVVWFPTFEHYQRGADSGLGGYAAEAGAAVKRRCSTMESAYVYATYGPLDDLETVSGYVGVYSSWAQPDYLYGGTWNSRRYVSPSGKFVIRQEDFGAIQAAERALAAEKQAKASGKVLAPKKSDMQAYLSEKFALLAETEEWAGGVVVVRGFANQIIGRYSNLVEDLKCVKAGSRYHCRMKIRSTTGPTVFQKRETKPVYHSVEDRCDWNGGTLRCDDTELQVEEIIRQRRAERGGSLRTGPGVTDDSDMFSAMDKARRSAACASAMMSDSGPAALARAYNCD